MSVRVVFWDSKDQKLSYGSAMVDVVPSVGDTVGILGSASAMQVRVKARHWRVDNLDDAPIDRHQYSVDLAVEPIT